MRAPGWGGWSEQGAGRLAGQAGKPDLLAF